MTPRASVGWIVLLCTFLCSKAAGQTLQEYEGQISGFIGTCLEYSMRSHWWSFDYCIQSTVLQYHKDETSQTTDSHFVGTYSHRTSADGTLREHYDHGEKCELENGQIVQRSADVLWRCCGTRKRDADDTFIEAVIERRPCHYELRICSPMVCTTGVTAEKSSLGSESISKDHAPPSKQHTYVQEPEATPNAQGPSPPSSPHPQRADDILASLGVSSDGNELLAVSDKERQKMLERIRQMFFTAYDGYMRYAFPAGELRPLTCRPGNFDLIKINAVTLIDTLDMLAIMGNGTEFRRALHEVLLHTNFDVDVNVSVFESTIRLLGGLLSAHLFAIDPTLGLVPAGSYNGELLELAQDLGDRLMPAFETRTGIPFGTVNLKYGVPVGESEVANTAGAGSLSMEFYVLSQLTGEPKYFRAADNAVRALFNRKSDLGLLGKHIHIHSGKWTEQLSGIGSNADSVYEYLLKMYLLSDDDSYWQMFAATYLPARSVLQHGDWFVDVDMTSGKVRRYRFENLQSFWPGMEVLLGNLRPAKRFLNAFYAVWNEFGFVPEEFDFVQWQLVNGDSSLMYPLRPELIESTYYMYQATQDRSWMRAGVHFLTSIDMDLETTCGFASVRNVGTTELVDNMPSFFLSETLKYLYLLFDTDNFIHSRPFIFSTEAHPFDMTFISRLNRTSKGQPAARHVSQPDRNRSQPSIQRSGKQKQHKFDVASPKSREMRTNRLLADDYIPRYCPALPWFESLNYEAGTSSTHTHTRTQQMELFNAGPDQCSIESALLLPSLEREPDPVAKAAASQGVLDVPGIGRFLVDMADGVTITHEASGEKLELQNLGYDVVVLRNTVGRKSKLVMADNSGTMVSCTVMPGFVQPPQHTADMDTFPQEFLQHRYCSVAAYGPTASGQDVRPITGEVVVPDNQYGCGPNKRSWWSGQSPLENKLVLVKRGHCMFEEKTRNAAAAGATGVLVTNNNNDLFVMAGMKESEASDLPEIGISTVMVTESDGKLLGTFMELARRRKLRPQLTVEVSQYPSVLANEIMGFTDWPLVHVQHNLLHIQPAGQWEVWLASADQRDWRITIAPKTAGAMDVSMTNYLVAFTQRGQALTVPSRGTTNAVRLYNYFSRQICPAVFDVRASNHIVLL